jgi:hypothetical protein
MAYDELKAERNFGEKLADKTLKAINRLRLISCTNLGLLLRFALKEICLFSPSCGFIAAVGVRLSASDSHPVRQKLERFEPISWNPSPFSGPAFAFASRRDAADNFSFFFGIQMNGKGKRMSIKYARFTETRSEADPKKRAERTMRH